MTEANVTHFNKEALSWDSNPWVQRATTLAHKAYLDHLPPPPTLSTYNVLDLGCGTGLLSLAVSRGDSQGRLPDISTFQASNAPAQQPLEFSQHLDSQKHVDKHS